MELKIEKVSLAPKGYKKGFPLKLLVHYDKDCEQYVLCYRRTFGWVHFTIEECEDMVRILKKYQKE